MIAPRLRIRLPSAPKDGTPSQRQWFAAVTNWINAVVDDTQTPVAETQDKVTRRSLQIDMVDNTPDLEKPLSQAAQARFTAIQESLSRLTASTSVTVISDWDVAATSATPTTAKSGMYFRATTAGTVGALSLSVGDVVLFYLDNTGALQWIIVDSPAERSAAYTPADWDATTGVARILNKPTLFGLSSLLTGLGAGSNAVIAATDTLINALAKLQAQVDARGLTNLVEVLNTAAPNTTVPVVGWTPNSIEAKVDLVLSPKGTGAIIAQVPDGTVTGGNKRGTGAVDLQMSRGAAAQVALGAYSVAMGLSNTSSGNYSVAMGSGNTASGNASVALGSSNSASGYASVAMGQSSVASGAYSVALGGNNTASGAYSVAMGQGNGASGQASVAMGNLANTRIVPCATAQGWSLSLADFSSSVSGSYQSAVYPLWNGTTGTAPVSLFSGTISSVDRYPVIPARHGWSFEAAVCARSPSDFVVWDIKGMVVCNASGVATLVGTPTITKRGETSAVSWSVAVGIKSVTGGNAVDFIVTGAASTKIAWNATMRTIETFCQ